MRMGNQRQKVTTWLFCIFCFVFIRSLRLKNDWEMEREKANEQTKSKINRKCRTAVASCKKPEDAQAAVREEGLQFDEVVEGSLVDL